MVNCRSDSQERKKSRCLRFGLRASGGMATARRAGSTGMTRWEKQISPLRADKGTSRHGDDSSGSAKMQASVARAALGAADPAADHHRDSYLRLVPPRRVAV